MIWIILLLSKVVFGYMLIRFYKKLKQTSKNPYSIQALSLIWRKRAKRLYLIIFGIIAFKVLSSFAYGKWQDSQGFDKRIIGIWTCFEGADELVFYNDQTYILDGEVFGEWSIHDSILTLYSDGTSEYFEVNKLTGNELELYDTDLNFRTWCEKG